MKTDRRAGRLPARRVWSRGKATLGEAAVRHPLRLLTDQWTGDNKEGKMKQLETVNKGTGKGKEEEKRATVRQLVLNIWAEPQLVGYMI